MLDIIELQVAETTNDQARSGEGNTIVTLMRFGPDDQSGNGFIHDFILASAQEGWKGLKTGGPLGLTNIAGGIPGVKRGSNRAIKRKALQEINKVAKRKVNDLFGE